MKIDIHIYNPELLQNANGIVYTGYANLFDRTTGR